MATTSHPTPATAPRHLRVFLASPGDVANERIVAQQVLEQLPYDAFLRGKVTLEIVAWDKPGAGTPMLASMDPQEAIAQGLPKPSDCDIVVVAFWSRMGTLLSRDWIKPERWRYLANSDFKDLDARYLSGTEWEYFDALEAKEKQGRPQVLVYRRTEIPSLDQRDPQFDEKRRQWKLLEAFFSSFRNPDGSLRRGCNEYTGPDVFGKDLDKHLKQIIRNLLEAPSRPPAPGPGVPTRGTATGPVPVLWAGSPFPGLRTFTEKDAPIFFGRGRDIDALIGKLVEGNRVVAVVGASGSGKSSLVWAGLIPRLLGQVVPGGDERSGVGAVPGSQDWIWRRFTPGELGDDPFLALAARLSPALEREGRAPRDVAVELANDPGALGPWVERMLEGLPQWAELILFVDQFEELLTLAQPECHEPFADLLNRAAGLNRVRTIITLRADFYHRCLDAPALRSLFDPQRLERGQYPLLAPGPVQLHEMIVRPAERAGLSFDPGLVERILNDTGAEPGALALMAFALAELYQARTPGGDLTGAAYGRFGGVHGAIGKRADDTFARLQPAVRARLSEVFRNLVAVDERGMATRRRVPMSGVADSDPAQVLVDALTQARLLVTGRSEGDKPVVEVAHEALFRSWPLLDEWIRDKADDLRLRRQIEQLAAHWERHGRRDEHRWPDNRVAEAASMIERLGLKREAFTDTQRDFLGPLEAGSMLEEIQDPRTSHERRALIGVRLACLGDPRPGAGLAEDDLPDIVWCHVPGGQVTLELQGQESPGTGQDRQQQPLRLEVQPLRIAKYPVTYVQYRAFVEAPDGYRNPAWWQGLLEQIPNPGRQFNRHDNHPAENVRWLDAVAFCRWLSARRSYEIRLPTEWEWQQAATGGVPAHQYPWGPGWDGRLANTDESKLQCSTAAGMFPQGASPIGTLDMAGNVWEWCLNPYDSPAETDVPGDSRRVIRGGAFVDSASSARCACRNWSIPRYRSYDLGFRVATSPDPRSQWSIRSVA